MLNAPPHPPSAPSPPLKDAEEKALDVGESSRGKHLLSLAYLLTNGLKSTRSVPSRAFSPHFSAGEKVPKADEGVSLIAPRAAIWTALIQHSIQHSPFNISSAAGNTVTARSKLPPRTPLAANRSPHPPYTPAMRTLPFVTILLAVTLAAQTPSPERGVYLEDIDKKV